MTVKIEIQVDQDVLDAISEAAIQSPRRMNAAYKKRIKRLRQNLLDELRQYPGPVKYPFKWKSDRQRRAYFATDGFGWGIPYVRTNALRDSWTTRIRDRQNGAIFEVENKADYARFVVGDDAQPGHLNTGWRSSAVIISEYREKAVDELIDTWYAVVSGEE